MCWHSAQPLRVKRRACGVLAGGIADHPGEVADQEQHVMAKILQLAQLVDEHRMPEMQIGRGRVEPGLDPQGAPGPEPFHKLGLDQQFIAAAPDCLKLRVDRRHGVQYFTMRNSRFATRSISAKLPLQKSSGKSCGKPTLRF
jgi:hypothetical protein